MDAKDVINALLLELVKSPTHRMTIGPEHADPSLLGRLREMAGMTPAASAGTIDVTVNRRAWRVDVAIGENDEGAVLAARAV